MKVEVRTNKGRYEGFGGRALSTSAHQRVLEYRDYGAREDYGGQNVQGLIRKEDPKRYPRKLEEQREEDEMVRKMTEYVNERLPLSVALCKANACEKNLEPYEYIRKHVVNPKETQRTTTTTTKKTLPRMVVEVYRIPEFCTVYVIPKEEAEVSSILARMHTLTKELSKTTWSNLESVLDYLIEKWNHFVSIGLRMHTDGEWYQDRKLAEHMYRTWAERYKSSLLFIEDPFDETEPEPIVPFELPPGCGGTHIVYGRYIASDIHRLGEWLATCGSSSKSRKGVCIRLNETGIVTEAIDAIGLIREREEEEMFMVMVSLETEGYEGNPEMVVDIAVGGGAGYLRIGRIEGEGVVVQGLNRLLEISTKEEGK